MPRLPAEGAERWAWHALSLLCLPCLMALALGAGLHGMQVREVGGTLLGGPPALAWALPASTALLLAWALGLTGARRVCGLAFLMQSGYGLLQWWHYPDERQGQLIFSPQRHELLAFALACAAVTLASQLLPRAQPRTAGPLRWTLAVSLGLLCAWSLALATVAFLRADLPPCSFDAESGQQLSLCLGDEQRVLR